MIPSKSKLTQALIAVALPLAMAAFTPSAHAALSLTFSTSTPTPGLDDISNLTGAAADRDNLGGNGTTDGNYNDADTYIANDRADQGQTFTTSSNVGGYTLTSISLQHVGFTSNTDLTWWRQPTGSVFTLRLTDPSAAGTGAFALVTETYTITGSEPNKLSSTITNSANGTGTWFTFTFSTPIALSANTLYGFDLSTGSANNFFELLGDKNSSFAGGTAYKGGTNGSADNALNTITGDRVFNVGLTAVPEPSSVALVIGLFGVFMVVMKRRRRATV